MADDPTAGPPAGKNKDLSDILGDLEDSLFSTEDQTQEAERFSRGGAAPSTKAPKKTLPVLIDEKGATDIYKDILHERNIRKHKEMGVDIVFRPYWFFTYTCELLMRDQDKNVIDSQEFGGREAIDAINGGVADYLPKTLQEEPIELVDLDEEVKMLEESNMAQYKVEHPRIKEEELQKFVQQKIAGVVRAEKENTSVAGFELVYAPVWRFWFEHKKRPHNIQIDAATGMPANYDDLPLNPKTWKDVVVDDLLALKNPKKWSKFVKSKAKFPEYKGAKGGGAGFNRGGKPRDWSAVVKSALLAADIGLILYAMTLRNLQTQLTYLAFGLIFALILAYSLFAKPRPVPPPRTPLPTP